MVLDSRLTCSVIYNFCLGYRVEGSGGHHEVADDFTKVSYLNPDVPEEGIARPYLNDHDCFRVYSSEEDFDVKIGSE